MESFFNQYEYTIKGFSAIGTLVIGLVVAFIAWRQWKTAEYKRQQDLFDKRWNFYISAKKRFLDELEEDSKPNYKKDSVKKYIENSWIKNLTDEAFFLFGSDIEEHISKNFSQILEKKGKNTIADPAISFRKPFEQYLKVKG
jgi:hypothetical protein